ncbi:hypothetical protein BH20ACT6_BH20ACT6_01350 [soil metagenome]
MTVGSGTAVNTGTSTPHGGTLGAPGRRIR